jgi:hypothetical protein
MIKFLPISYPSQCTFRDEVSKIFCTCQGRAYSVKCMDHWNDFPADCPLKSLTDEDKKFDHVEQPLKE